MEMYIENMREKYRNSTVTAGVWPMFTWCWVGAINYLRNPGGDTILVARLRRRCESCWLGREMQIILSQDRFEMILKIPSRGLY